MNHFIHNATVIHELIIIMTYVYDNIIILETNHFL